MALPEQKRESLPLPSQAELEASVRRHIEEYRRLVILKVLLVSPTYCVSEDVLADVLADAGVGASFDRVRADLAWLEEQGLVTIKSNDEDFGAGNPVKLTRRGVDVARGLAIVPGIARPNPN